jgi:hypothetical protein
MAVGGGKPGITVKATVVSMLAEDAIVLKLEKKEDVDYFQGKIGNEYMVQFHPVARDGIVGYEGEPADG